MKKLIKWSKQNWLVWVIAIAYAVLAFSQPDQAARAGIISVQEFIKLLATFIAVFLFVGLFNVWINDDLIIKHLGEESGVRGLALGAGLGTVIHGPLIGIFPLLKALMSKGAKVGVIIAIVSTWAIKLPMLPLEIKLFGWKFTLIRNGLLFASAFIMAPLMELILGPEWINQFRKPSDEADSITS